MGPLIFFAVAAAYLGYSGRRRGNALVGAAVLLPYNQYLPSSGVPFLNVQMLVVMALIWTMARGSEGGTRKPIPGPPFALYATALFLVIAFVTALFAEVPAHLQWAYDTNVLIQILRDKLSVLLICYAAFKIADDAPMVHRVFWGATIGFGAEILFCTLEFFVKATKVTGHMEAKNPMGAFLATYGAAAIAFYLTYKGHKWRWVYLGLGLGAGLATLGTRSRGGILALAATLFFVAAWKNRVVLVILIVLAATWQVWMPDYLVERFDEAVETTETGEVEFADTAASRIELWKAGFRIVPDYPFGVGLGMYRIRVADPKYLPLDAHIGFRVRNAHNEFVLNLVELGPLGFFFYMLLLASLGLRALKTYRDDPDAQVRAIGVAALCALMGDATASLALSLILRADISGILWILLGVTARRASEIRYRQATARSR